MKTYFVLLASSLFCLTSCSTKVSWNENLDAYFAALETFEFRKSRNLISNIQNEPVKEHLILISDALYHNGTLILNKPDSFNEELLQDDFIKTIDFLSKGIYELRYNYKNDESFTNLVEAYKLAKTIENNSLTKYVLISILELYKKEILLSNNQYKIYLEELRLYSDSIEDEVRCNLYEVMFYAKTIDQEVDEKYFELFEEIDMQMNRLDSNSSLWMNYYIRSGIKFQLLGDFESSEKEFLKGLEASKKLKGPFLRYFLFEFNIKLAQNFTLKEQYEEAKSFFSKAEELLSPKKISKDKYLYYYHLSNFFQKTGNWKDSYLAFEEHTLMGHQLDYRGNTLEIAQRNIQYETEKKVSENNQLKQNIKYLLAGTMAIIALGLVIGFLIQKNTTRKRKLAQQETLLEQQKVQTLLKEQELVSIDAMIAGQEKERTKVANELHDDLGSLMATVKLHFDNVKVDEKDPALLNAQKLLDQAYQKIRGMAHSKNSGVMANQGLLPAVQKMARTINETNALEVTVEDFGLGERMENSLELTIFRMLQELVANIIKHSEAKKATIQFTQHEDKLNIIVEDNGKGFDMSAVKRSSSGMGLGTIEKRIEHLEGTFTVDSVIGKGTSILIDIPV